MRSSGHEVSNKPVWHRLRLDREEGVLGGRPQPLHLRHEPGRKPRGDAGERAASALASAGPVQGLHVLHRLEQVRRPSG